MAKSLVVVESPAKAKTIKKYLGNDFEVKASVGHVIDLPPHRMGVDLESGEFTAEYVPIVGKGKVIKELEKASKKASVVYLAPDPDREGEAIAYHIAQVIKNKSNGEVPKIYRVRFHEITKKAIQKAFETPTEIDMNLYDAQQARRILDRVVGYQISPILWKKVKRGLSAGRVQSVALRLVADKEREIAKFKTEEYWTIEAIADAHKNLVFPVKLLKIDGKKATLTNEKEASSAQQEIKQAKSKITEVQKKQRQRRPKAPFITSKLQQDAARAFRFTAKRTMALAQSLYEGVELGAEGAVGLITYMRTDSTTVSKDAVFEVRGFITKNFGKNYLPEKPNFFKNKKSAQEAHEAIRPTATKYTPKFVKPFLKPEQYKLYSLIFNRFVASQMATAKYEQTQIDIESGRHTLRATGAIMRFDGFLKVYNEQVDEDDKAALDEAKQEHVHLPDVEKGDEIELKKVNANQHFTQPPPKFNEASLVKELEEKGIGRPSTYASILSTIQDKGYVEKSENRFSPSELGLIVTDLLKESFPDIMDVAFTAEMEEKLDKIEEGKNNLKDTLQNFYAPFKKAVLHAQESMRDIKRMEEPTDLLCEKCGSGMIVKWGKNGSFLGCSNYPTCSNTSPFKRVDGKVVIEKVDKNVDVDCQKCGAKMALKQGKYGRFLGCSRYPDCTFTMPLPTGIKCPKEGCTGDVVQKRGRQGKTFYGCSKYPDCEFVSWNMPVNKKCPMCENPYIVVKTTKSGKTFTCPACKAVVEE
ncbi:type I DNA topoisomerase [Sulfobacillus acidophilus]|uniref:DNA topoisomerase 1 n=1 Tax=Sulfobacillus acidophilus TaxID=53633 RepID=A0ABS3AYU6_9FIRM|nr:type I DNA topoisomerase [Sulfobacillus acidophilus]